MKKFIALIGTGAFAVAFGWSAVAQPSALPLAQSNSSLLKNSYLPLKEEIYSYNADNDEWRLSSFVEYTVNKTFGLYDTSISNYGGSSIRGVFTYNDRGQQVEYVTSLYLDDWLNLNRQTAEFDDIVTDYAVKQFTYSWNDEWVLSSGYSYDIVRNDKGVVLSNAQGSVFSPDDLRVVCKTECTVSDDGSAITGIKYYYSDYSPEHNLILQQELRDIEWHTTNGQYLLFNPSDLSDAANRMSYARIYNDGELEGEIVATYDGDDYSFSITYFESGTGYEEVYTVTDPLSGSYRKEITQKFLDLTDDRSDINGDGLVDENDRILRSAVTVENIEFNEHGAMTRNRTVYYRDGDFYMARDGKYNYTYDSEGHLLERVQLNAVSPEDENTEFVPRSKNVYSNFYTFTGAVDGVAAAQDATVSLSGRILTVESPSASDFSLVALDGTTVLSAFGEGSYTVPLHDIASGLYIASVRTGASIVTTKIVVR